MGLSLTEGKAMKEYMCEGWQAFTEPNEDRPGVNVYLEHISSGDVVSLACAECEGETSEGRPVPIKAVLMAFDWIAEKGIDY